MATTAAARGCSCGGAGKDGLGQSGRGPGYLPKARARVSMLAAGKSGLARERARAAAPLPGRLRRGTASRSLPPAPLEQGRSVGRPRPTPERELRGCVCRTVCAQVTSGTWCVSEGKRGSRSATVCPAGLKAHSGPSAHAPGNGSPTEGPLASWCLRRGNQGKGGQLGWEAPGEAFITRTAVSVQRRKPLTGTVSAEAGLSTTSGVTTPTLTSGKGHLPALVSC